MWRLGWEPSQCESRKTRSDGMGWAIVKTNFTWQSVPRGVLLRLNTLLRTSHFSWTPTSFYWNFEGSKVNLCYQTWCRYTARFSWRLLLPGYHANGNGRRSSRRELGGRAHLARFFQESNLLKRGKYGVLMAYRSNNTSYTSLRCNTPAINAVRLHSQRARIRGGPLSFLTMCIISTLITCKYTQKCKLPIFLSRTDSIHWESEGTWFWYWYSQAVRH
jgi:hypothetical protein